MKNYEGFGVDYERYAIIKLQSKLINHYKIKSVIEIPAGGTKAAPSLYSIGFGLKKCNVLLVNGNKYMKKYWKKLGIEKNVKFIQENSIYQTTISNNAADLVWNYAYIPECKNPLALIKEMKRISNRFVMCASVNGLNPGYWVHRTIHKITKIPWTHGDKKLNFPRNLIKLFKKAGLKDVKIGVVDCPPWPDSLGFRDMRLHRQAETFSIEDWKPQIIEMLKNNKIPKWMHFCYLIESLPIPTIIKFIYAHIFYVIGEK